MNLTSNKLKVIKWATGIVGILFIVISKFADQDSNGYEYFAYGFLLLSFAFLFEAVEELQSGVAKVAYGSDTIEKQKQPFIYWSVIIIHFLSFVGGISVAYFIYPYS